MTMVTLGLANHSMIRVARLLRVPPDWADFGVQWLGQARDSRSAVWQPLYIQSIDDPPVALFSQEYDPATERFPFGFRVDPD